jgi:Flp pilus assembly protein TadG
MKRECSPNLVHRKNERGSVLAYTVISTLFLFLAVGLGTDLSHLYLVRTELQNAADAAALAGASALLLPPEERIPTAVQRAVDTLNKNKYNFNNQDFEDVLEKAKQADLVEFAVNLDDDPYMSAAAAAKNPNIRFVRVKTPTVSVNIFFSIPILGLARDMAATATSGLSKPNNVFCNFVPIAVVEGPAGGGLGWQDFNGDGKLEYATDCDPPKPKPGATPSASPTPECKPAEAFCPGCRYKMIAGPGQWQDTSPGNYQALDAGSGAKDLKLAIAGGTTMCLTVGEDATFVTETSPGRMTGPVLKGLNTRFDEYKAFGDGGTVIIGGVTKSVVEAFPPDPNIYDAAPSNKNLPYPGISFNYYNDEHGIKVAPAIGHASSPDRRQILMPIINYKQFEPGKTTVEFTKFGKFFMNRKVGGIPSSPEIYVEFVEPALGSGGFDPSGGPTAPVVVPVLYR